MVANPNASQVRVGVRIRPLTSKETTEGGHAVVESNAFNRTVSLSKRKFTYDSVFHSNVTQSDLYTNAAPPLLNSFLNGYNATVLAYGQTGSGKTYTMGSEAHGHNFAVNGGGKLGEDDGLIPRFMDDLFGSLFRKRDASEKALLRSRDVDNVPAQSVSLIDFRVSASFLEVYGEDIYDLLDENRNSLKLREDSNKEVIVVGLQSKDITSASEAINVLNTGTMNRTTASTLMNFTSSRSHAVFTVNLQQTTRSAEGDEINTMSRFTFVDLAGSERMKKTGAEGERAKEGIKINEGLLALGNVINALADDERLTKGEKIHVPYRQSKLTRLLQDALGGNSQTLFLACVSPSDTNASETLSTLHYANRARNIKNAPTRNVDATAEELRRLRTLTSLLKCELIKQRFNKDPEVERANSECAINLAEIGRVNDDLLRRDDVVAYMRHFDEKVSELSGSTSGVSIPISTHSSVFTPDRSVPHSFVHMPSSHSSREHASHVNEGASEEEEDELSEMDVNPDEDMQSIDEMQDNEQISKIDGDIEEQEERLLQLKEHIQVYNDMKEKYELLMDHVEKLEYEKAQLAEKLKEMEKDPSKSQFIKNKLENVKSSLAKARQDVRKQQQKCREAEQDAQRCKGLERRIDEMKNAKANLIKKQKEDAKKRKDFTKTKAREIQLLRRNEKSAQKQVIKLQSECQRYKASLDNSKSRYEKLSDKLKQTESNLKKANAKRRTNSSIGARHFSDLNGDGPGQFAPANGKINSIKFVLERTVSDRVALSQNREVYALKAAEREKLVQSMATEVKILNELKRECESTDSENFGNTLKRIHYAEEFVQEFLIKIELVETHLEELRARYPAIENDDKRKEKKDNTFDEHEPGLKIISKLNAPMLRTLLLKLLGSCYTAELGRQTAKDELAKKGFLLSTLENEVATQKEKVGCLSKSLSTRELHSRKKANKLENDSLVSDTDELLLELGKTKDALFASEEKRREAEVQLAHAIAKGTEQLATSLPLDDLRAEIEASTLSEIQRIQSEAEHQRVSEVERITNDLKVSHALELATAKKSQSNQSKQLMASHSEELARVRTDMKSSISEAIAKKTEELAISHTEEIQNLRAELQAAAAFDLVRAQLDAEKQQASEIERITSELNKSHLVEKQLAITKQLEQLKASHSEELVRVRSEVEVPDSKANTQTNGQLSASHAKETYELRTELQAAATLELKRVQTEAEQQMSTFHAKEIHELRAELQEAATLELDHAQAEAEQQRVSEIERITNELKESYAVVQSEIISSQSEQLEQLAISHSEELTRLRSEMEASALDANRQTKQHLSISHAEEIQTMREELQKAALLELERVQADAEKQRVSDIDRATKELNQFHAVELKSAIVKSQSEQLEHLTSSHIKELALVRSETEASTLEAIAQKTEQLSTSHAEETKNLRAELQKDAFSELERVHANAEEQRISDIARITHELNESHAVELKSAIAKSQSEQFEQLTVSHNEELARVRSEMEASVSEATAHTAKQLSTSHAEEIQNLKATLQVAALLELKRAHTDADEQRLAEVERTKTELNESHAVGLKSAIAKSQSEQLIQLTASHNEELARVRSEMESSTSDAIAQTTEQLSAFHATEIQNLRAELQVAASSELERVRADADQQRISEVERMANKVNESHAVELKSAIAKSQSEQLEHLTVSHDEELARVRSEMEALTSSHAEEIQNLRSELQKAALLDRTKAQAHAEDQQMLIASHTEELVRVRSELDASTSQILAQQKKTKIIQEKVNSSVIEKDSMLRELAETKEALTLSIMKEMNAKEQLAQLRSQQKEAESIEHQVNSSVSNKDLLAREIEKTALLKELNRTKNALSQYEEKHAKIENELAQINEEKQLQYIWEMKRDGDAAGNNSQAATHEPQDVKEINYSTPVKSTSLVIDVDANSSQASSEKIVTPSSSRSSSSAILPTFSKLQRYRKKNRESAKSGDNAKPKTTPQETSRDVKRDVADSRRQSRYRDSSKHKIAKSPR